MNKDDFRIIMAEFFVNYSLEADKAYLDYVFFKLTEKQITFSQLRAGVNKVNNLSRRDFFEKYSGLKPTIKDWLDLCGYKECSEEDLFNQAKLNFREKVAEYLSSGFVNQKQRSEFYLNLCDNEKRALSLMGGIELLYSQVNDDNNYITISYILNQLDNFFQQIYQQNPMPFEKIQSDKTKAVIVELTKRLDTSK